MLRILQCLLSLEDLSSGKLKLFYKYQFLGQCPGPVGLHSALVSLPGKCSLTSFWGVTALMCADLVGLLGPKPAVGLLSKALHHLFFGWD